MQMSSLIDQSGQKQKKKNSVFLDKLKSIIHDELKNNTIIFTITNQNNQFHYYTYLDSNKIPLIQLYWVIDFLPNMLTINITYTTYRTLGIPIVLNDLRTKIQVNYALKLINKNVPPFITYLLNEKNEVSIVFQRSFFHQTDRLYLLKGIRSIISQTLTSARQQFQTIIPYLTIPIESYFKSVKIDKDNQKNQQFNLIKLKNTFDRFRSNRQKITELAYEQKDIIKTRKRIQQCTKLFGMDLRSLDNLKYMTKQIQTDKLLQILDKKIDKIPTTKVDRIAYQFQIIQVKQTQKKCEVNANSEIYFGKYSFRIFKTLIQQDKISKSFNLKKTGPIFQENDIIEQRVACLVKKKAMNKLSQKALRNQTSFLKFMRNQICLYIANYFLPLESSWNELYIEQYESTLLSLINEQDMKKPFSTWVQIMKKILLGLRFIAESNICHRDIKPSNIMLNKANDPKIIDFGSAISVYNQKVIMSCNEKLCGTQGFYFPYEDCDEKIKKVFDKKQYESHPLFDIYSYGVIVQKLFQEELSERSTNQTIKDTLIYIVQRCKQKNPDDRLSYDEVLCLLLALQRVLQSSRRKKQPSVVL